jgi:hypothetical protein
MPDAAFNQMVKAIAEANWDEHGKWIHVAAEMGPALRGFRGQVPANLGAYLCNTVVNRVVDWLQAQRSFLTFYVFVHSKINIMIYFSPFVFRTLADLDRDPRNKRLAEVLCRKGVPAVITSMDALRARSTKKDDVL